MLRIWGIEATQSTQFFGSSCRSVRTPPAIGSLPDNSVSLVAGKPIVLRLYVSGAAAGDNLGAVVTVPDMTVFGSTAKIVGTGGMVVSALQALRLDAATTIQVVLRAQPPGRFVSTSFSSTTDPIGAVSRV